MAVCRFAEFKAYVPADECTWYLFLEKERFCDKDSRSQRKSLCTVARFDSFA